MNAGVGTALCLTPFLAFLSRSHQPCFGRGWLCSQPSLDMRIDNATIIANLKPAPSLSRTGKMAELAMSSQVLAKAGVQVVAHPQC